MPATKSVRQIQTDLQGTANGLNLDDFTRNVNFWTPTLAWSRFLEPWNQETHPENHSPSKDHVS